VIDLMKDLVAEFGMGIIFITHDLGVIAQTADRVAVMYLGRIVEEGPVREVIANARASLHAGLINALPKLDDLDAPLTPVPGDIPSRSNGRRAASFTPAARWRPGLRSVVPARREVRPGHVALPAS
jgi:peptide/nickel transport system ATP-binding protein